MCSITFIMHDFQMSNPGKDQSKVVSEIKMMVRSKERVGYEKPNSYWNANHCLLMAGAICNNEHNFRDEMKNHPEMPDT